MRSTCPVHLNLPNLITLIILREESTNYENLRWSRPVAYLVNNNWHYFLSRQQFIIIITVHGYMFRHLKCPLQATTSVHFIC
jgi:hypothetical protein